MKEICYSVYIAVPVNIVFIKDGRISFLRYDAELMIGVRKTDRLDLARNFDSHELARNHAIALGLDARGPMAMPGEYISKIDQAVNLMNTAMNQVNQILNCAFMLQPTHGSRILEL